MTKISKFFLNKASYIAFDENGKRFTINIDYWNGTAKVGGKNKTLEEYVKKLIDNKHRTNFAYKINGEKENE